MKNEASVIVSSLNKNLQDKKKEISDIEAEIQKLENEASLSQELQNELKKQKGLLKYKQNRLAVFEGQVNPLNIQKVIDVRKSLNVGE